MRSIVFAPKSRNCTRAEWKAMDSMLRAMSRETDALAERAFRDFIVFGVGTLDRAEVERACQGALDRMGKPRLAEGA